MFVVTEGISQGGRCAARPVIVWRCGELKKPERLVDLAEHQQAQVRELEVRSQQELAIVIQNCYRHVFYPSRNRIGGSHVDLAHTAIDLHSTSDKPGAGQRQVMRALRDLNKLRLSEDEPDSPAYVRDRTPLKKGEITTLALRDEFRRNPALPILIGDNVFIRGVRRGIEHGEYVYRRGELVFGPGRPVSQHQDRRAIVYLHHGSCQECRHLAAEKARRSDPHHGEDR